MISAKRAKKEFKTRDRDRAAGRRPAAKCPDCGKPVGSRSKACPACGTALDPASIRHA